MPLYIKDPEAYELASELAEHTGKSLTRVVVDALRQEKKGLISRKVDRGKINAILAEAHALPDLDSRSAGRMIADLYDEAGLPK